MKTQAIPGWIPSLIAPLIAVVKSEFTSKLKDQELRVAVDAALEAVQETAVVLSDDIEDNSEQAKQVWLKFIYTEVSDLVEAKTLEGISSISNPTIREPLLVLAPAVVHMVRLVTDQDPNNKRQIEAHWSAFIKDRGNQEVILSIVDRVIEANLDGAVKMIAVTLWATLKGILRDRIDEI